MNDNELKNIQKHFKIDDVFGSLPKLAIITQSTQAWGSKYLKLCKQLRLQNTLAQKNKSLRNQRNLKINKCHAFIELLEKRRKYFISGSKIPTRSKSSEKQNEKNKIKINTSLCSRKDRALFNKNKSKDSVQQQQLVIVKKKSQKQDNAKSIRYKSKKQANQQKKQTIKQKIIQQKKQKSKKQQINLQNSNLSSQSLHSFLVRRHNKIQPSEKLIKIYPQSFSFKNQKEGILSPWQAQVPDFSNIQI